MSYEIPGEILIMDFETGTFKVQNDVRDRAEYQRSLFLEDEVAEVGRKKSRKKRNDRSGPGGGGMDN